MFYDVYERLCYQCGEKPYSLPVKLGLMKKNTAIANWKNGSVPRASTVQALAEYFGVSVPYLLDMQETPSTAEGEGLNDAQQEALSYIKTLNDEQLRRFVAILIAMHQLNAEGQERLVEYADDLTATGKYKKHDFNEVALQKEA